MRTGHDMHMVVVVAPPYFEPCKQSETPWDLMLPLRTRSRTGA